MDVRMCVGNLTLAGSLRSRSFREIKIEAARWRGGRRQSEYMKKNLRLLAFYLVPVVLLSSVDITYEWFAPLTIEDGTTIKWYAFAGLRGGLVRTGNNETGRAADFTLNSHAPQFIPLPFYVGAGPEGGSMVISIWFIGLVGWSAQALLRMRAQRKAAKKTLTSNLS